MRESICLICFITLFIFILSIPGCRPIETDVNECTISYTIGDSPSVFTETIMMDMPDMYTPAYTCGNGLIKLVGSGPGSYQMPYKTIYEGDQPVRVIDFNYHFVRHYKASRWDGHELKSRKK